MARSRSRSSGTILSGPDCAMIDRFPLAANEESIVEQRREDGTHHRADPIRRLPLEDAAGDRRSERTRGIERAAREGADRENAGGDREADGETADAWGLRVDRRPKNHEHEEERH